MSAEHTDPFEYHGRDRGKRGWEVLRTSLRLGLTSFGGPIAHLGYFEHAYVRERRWLTTEEYGGLVALCQILPGPASSQVGFLIGLHRAGWLGALAAWIGFTLPSALLMYAFAVLSTQVHGPFVESVLHGLKLVAVVVVAQAVWSMGRKLCPDRQTTAIALVAASALLVVGGAMMQLVALAAGIVCGIAWCGETGPQANQLTIAISRTSAWSALGLFLLLLAGLPLLASLLPHSYVALADVFYRAGALVFGGGHVVLPLLRDAMVPGGWIADERFLTGYGLAQAVPGPLFTLAAYLGAASAYSSSPAIGAAVAVTFIFLPGALIAVAGASLWGRLARHRNVRAGLAGINAAVVGILGAALYDPVWTTAVLSGTDVAIVMVGLMLLERWKTRPIAVVALCLVLSSICAFVQ
jgi:chromate transporter